MMKKTVLLLIVLLASGCAHSPLKTTKKAPCDFEKREITAGYEDNTK
jgi:type IV pilus biogenesis protein CpaD/CtpE